MQDSEVIQLAALTCLQVMMTLYLQQDEILCKYQIHGFNVTVAVVCHVLSVSLQIIRKISCDAFIKSVKFFGRPVNIVIVW